MRRADALKVADPPYDCRKCGACCIADDDQPTYVTLMPSDMKRLTPAYREKALDERHFGASFKTKYDKQNNCVCIALRGTVGKRVSCSIYDRRPKVCEKFRPGSMSCEEARLIAGIGDGP